jgi:hypothetical protein
MQGIGLEPEHLGGVAWQIASIPLRLRNLLTWQLVRGVGELQILTRASYLMLGVVPILVGVWPSVRLVVNNHNRLLERATQELAATGEQLSRRADAVANTLQRLTSPLDSVSGQEVRIVNEAVSSFAAQVSTLSAEIEDEVEKLRREGTLSPWLPKSLALAFFASLAVAAGHAIYQARAPEVVRKNKLIDYVRERRAAFGEQHTENDFQAALEGLRDEHWYLNRAVAEALIASKERQGVIATNPMRGFYGKVFYEKYRAYVFSAVTSSIRRAALYVRELNAEQLSASTYASGDQKVPVDEDAADADDGTRSAGSALMISKEADDNGALVGCLFWYDTYELHESTEEYWKILLERGDLNRTMDDALRNFISRSFGRSSFDHSAEGKEKSKLDVIGQMARYEYLLASSQRLPTMLLVLTAYTIGAAIAIWVVGQQSYAVMKAAGWI